MKTKISFHCLRSCILVVVGLILFSACEAKNDLTKNPIREQNVYSIGAKKVFLEIADTPELRSLGLMHRKEMDEDHGMLFLFDRASPQNFWMKNTYIPLDIAYISPNGIILEIHPMKPLSTSSISSRSSNIQMALEMNQGWFEKNKISPGDKLRKSFNP